MMGHRSRHARVPVPESHIRECESRSHRRELITSAERQTGEVVAWVPARGFGFLAPETGGVDLFVGAREIMRLGNVPVGTKVTYCLATEIGGRLAAKELQVLT
jgi:cold shock CspA family protein